MKITYIILFMLYPLLTFGQKVPVSKKHEADNIHHIDLYKAYQNRDDFPLSKVIESMKYIPLETKQECLLGGCYTISMTSNDIFIFDFGRGVYRFSKDGKFINKIGKVGRGPEECQKPKDMVLDTISQQVILLDDDKIMVYNYQGKFVIRYKLSTKSNDMLPVNENVLLTNNKYYQYAKPEERNSMVFFSTVQKREIAKIPCEKKDKIPFSICDPIMYRYKQMAFVKDYWCDTIYRVIDPLNLESYAVINSGKLKHRDDDDHSIITGELNPKDKWVIDIVKIMETNRFIFLTSNKGLFYYDKNSESTICCNYKRGAQYPTVFTNDLTHGPDLMPFSSLHFINENSSITYDFAYNFFNEEGELIPGLGKSLKNLKPDDNPVLILVKFKK